MGTIKKFEDIRAWQIDRQLTRQIYNITSKNEFAKDFGLKEQIRKAAISIMLNIAEGFGKDTDSDFRKFLFQANGSVLEVQSALYIALDLAYINENEFKELYKITNEISRSLLSFSKYLAKNRSNNLQPY